MRKIMKLALEEAQIKVKSLYDRFDGYEIHLYGNQYDRFQLAEKLTKPIITVHYPISRCDVYDVCSECETPYFKQVVAFCKQYNAGLVMHAETGLDRLLTHPKLYSFLDYIKQADIDIHIENCYRSVGAIEGLRMMNFIKDRLNNNRVFPLLDTCHLIMSEMSFKFKEMSFFETIKAYKSENFKIHLNDCIGSGEKETGGIHGTNFYANQYLLKNIIWNLYELEQNGYPNIDLILEVDEVDYCYPTNADILAKNINHIYLETVNWYSKER